MSKSCEQFRRLNRRDFLRALISGPVGLSLSYSALAQTPTPPPIKAAKLSENLALISGDGGNALSETVDRIYVNFAVTGPAPAWGPARPRAASAACRRETPMEKPVAGTLVPVKRSTKPLVCGW